MLNAERALTGDNDLHSTFPQRLRVTDDAQGWFSRMMCPSAVFEQGT